MFKERFVKLCTEKGVSPAMVCEYIGLSNSAYSKWTETSCPRDTTLFRIANYFNVSSAYLKGETDDPEITLADRLSVTKENLASQKTDEVPDYELINLWKSLKPEEILRVKDFAQGLIAARKESASQQP